MANRPCFSDHSRRVSKHGYDRSNIHALLEYLFAETDLIDASLDDLVESRSTDTDQNDVIQRALHFGSVMIDAAKRCVRKRSSIHNASVWPLPTDLTIKVFSMLDTPNVFSAAATCSFFQKCATDPLCFLNIDLTTKAFHVSNDVVSTMIQRAGKALRSIKLGEPCLWPHCIPLHLTGSCLSFLSASGGAPGSQLRELHLYNIEMDNTKLLASLSFCPSLVDLELEGLNLELSRTLESVSRHCRLIERFIYESEEGREDRLEESACKEFVRNCPKITTLVLKYCELRDTNARRLVKGLKELKYVDFTGSNYCTGSFLKNLGTKRGGKNLEVMILHECIDLEKVKVEQFIKALLAGKFRFLRHLDISNNDGLVDYKDGDAFRIYDLSLTLIKQLLEHRPNFCLLAEFQ